MKNYWLRAKIFLFLKTTGQPSRTSCRYHQALMSKCTCSIGDISRTGSNSEREKSKCNFLIDFQPEMAEIEQRLHHQGIECPGVPRLEIIAGNVYAWMIRLAAMVRCAGVRVMQKRILSLHFHSTKNPPPHAPAFETHPTSHDSTLHLTLSYDVSHMDLNCSVR